MRAMRLNLPQLDALANCRNILIAGLGGGFDVFSGLPLYFEFQQRGLIVHLANYTFSDVSTIKKNETGVVHLTDTLVGVTADHTALRPYFPERYLAQWFREKRGEDVTVWCFEKTGARPLLANYHRLIEHLGLDGLVLVDGGVDSLVFGDEAEIGTAGEDSVSLCAVNQLDLPRVQVCIGLGAEQHITHAHIFENIATLTQAGAFLGACSLAPQMEAYQQYEEAVLYAQAQPFQDASVINSSIISAVQGHYGDFHLTLKTTNGRLWISPLMGLYWFFDLPMVAQHNRFLTQLIGTDTFREAYYAIMHARPHIPKRAPTSIPLP